MKIILNIGYRHFLIPPSVNVNAVITAFAKATPLKYEHVNGNYVYLPDTDDSTKVKIEMVEDAQVIDPKKISRKAIPETASPDSHNTF